MTSVTLKVTYDDGNIMFAFKIKSDVISCQVDIGEPTMFSKKEWNEFLGAVTDNKNGNLVFC